jgi:predicted ATPase with chaperone activity
VGSLRAVEPERKDPVHSIPAPESVAEVGIPRSVLEDLALKTLHIAGSLSLLELAAKMRLPYGVVEELCRRFRTEQLCDLSGMKGNVPELTINSRGRARAAELFSVNQYVGAAPVSSETYAQVVRQQSVRNLKIHARDVLRGFSDLVLDDKMLKKLGTAMNSGSSIFLYGPSGAGKTTIATALARMLALDPVWIPFAVEVDGQIITVYDRNIHIQANDPISQSYDARWVLCHRPTVLVGGELTIEMLDLQLNPVTNFYTAPMQMKANNGALIIDDFGRQRLRPEQLLNRWVVPLDRRIDFLNLMGGKSVQVPFELVVVFATNLDPSDLADAAFLRRIQTKIKVDAVSPQQFHEIFRRVCSDLGLTCDPQVVDASIDIIRNKLKEPLRACHPRDIVNQILWAANYEEREPRLDREALLEAVDAYFVGEAYADKETSFVSNPTDEKKLATLEHRQKIAESLYRGIAKYTDGLSGVKVAVE